jgi:PAS domain S-box-containing protein
VVSGRFAVSVESATTIAIIKGTVYVLVSTFLIYFLLKIDEKSQASLASELKTVNDSFSTLYLINPQPMLIFDPESLNIVAANEAVLKLFEYDRVEFLKMTLHSLVVSEENKPLKISAVNKNEDMYKTGPWKTITKSGKILYVDLINVRITYSGKFVTLASLIDISEQKDIEDTLKKTTVERDDFEAFGYWLSHDLRASLRAVTGYGQILKEDYQHVLDAKGLDYIERMNQAGLSMNKLIDSLLMLSGITRRNLQIELVDLGKIVREIADQLIKEDPERRATFKLLPEAFVRCDAELMRIALFDMMENAWKYTSKKAIAVIEFDQTINAEGKRVFFIKDNGIGFNPEEAEDMFKPFHRLHSGLEFQGSGIGLNVVSRIIARQKGSIWAEGQPGEGAAIYFTLGMDEE